MSDKIYKIVYCSHNMIQGSQADQDAQIKQILDISRINNRRDNVTGALLFSSGYFAQVLEGPQAAIERIFERIQRDPRHGDVTVLKGGSEEQRDFPEWSMAYVQGSSGAQDINVAAALDHAMADPSITGGEVLKLLRSLVIQED